MPQSFQQVSFGEPPSALTLRQGGRDAIDVRFHAVIAWKLPIALDLALLTEHACKDAIGF